MAKQWINISIIPVFYAQIIFSRFLYSIWKTILCISKTALSAYRESCTWHDNVALFQLVLGRRLHSTRNVRWLGVAKKSSPNFRSACCKIFFKHFIFYHSSRTPITLVSKTKYSTLLRTKSVIWVDIGLYVHLCILLYKYCLQLNSFFY